MIQLSHASGNMEMESFPFYFLSVEYLLKWKSTLADSIKKYDIYLNSKESEKKYKLLWLQFCSCR